MPADHHQPSASSDKGSTYLVSQFDTHLRNIADAYLGFFCERKRIEEAYNDSLLKLHQKAKGIDAYFDASIKSSTMKAAWVEVRDSLEREAQVRRHFLSALASDIIQPLTALKEAHGRIRERVQADLKESTATHADLAKKIPKFREAYLRKCQELKDDSSNGVIPNLPPNSDLSPISRLFVRPQSHEGSASTHLGRPLSRTGSLREFTRNTFHDLIRGNSRNTARSVFAKEVADQAEKEYRGAIHQLETLRLRKIASLEGASKRLEDVVLEGTETTKHVLLSYADVMAKASSAHFKLATDVRPVIENISAQRDTSTFVASVHASLAGSIPRPIIYYDYQVGECPDLVFGRTLVDYGTSQDNEDEVPKILNICINEVDRRGLDAEGIYRVKELQQRFERSERIFSFNPQRDDVYSIASLLKLYLKELPEPLFTLPLQDRIRHSEQLADENANVSLLRSKIHGLPAIHRASLGSLMKHLSRVASHATKNNMDSKSLAAIFSPLVLGKDEMPQGDPLKLLPNDSVMTNLIEMRILCSMSARPPVSYTTRPSMTKGHRE
ncbi:Rho GTPase activation protein [Russula brevipes]|nr:Rho GTPase activation protein [Russula brevipes]